MSLPYLASAFAAEPGSCSVAGARPGATSRNAIASQRPSCGMSPPLRRRSARGVVAFGRAGTRCRHRLLLTGVGRWRGGERNRLLAVEAIVPGDPVGEQGVLEQ